jgi:tripeptidyl-peptidase-1
MLYPSSILLALSSASVVFGYDYALKEKIYVPRGWSRVAPAPSEHKINLRIGLQQQDFAGLEQHLLQVSDRKHRRVVDHCAQ